MSFATGNMKVYKPVKELFDTPMYQRALELCWHAPSYKTMIALTYQLLRLQQRRQLPSSVTGEDMTRLLAVQRKEAQRVQSLWEAELGTCDAEIRPLLQLVWKVNMDLKMRDIEAEARRLLRTPRAVPPEFQHPKIINKAHMYAKRLTKQEQQRGPETRLLCPMGVVLEVVPKVLRGCWLLPPTTSFNMPSQQLSKMAVGITKAVQDRVSKSLCSVLLHATFSTTIRGEMALAIHRKVRREYNGAVLEEKLECFATDVQRTITNVAAEEICALFQTSAVLATSGQPHTASPEPDSAVIHTPACAPTTTDEPLMDTASPEPDSAVIHTPACAPTTTDEPLMDTASPEPDSAVIHTPASAPTTTDEPLMDTASPEPDSAVVRQRNRGKFTRFVQWLKKRCCCLTAEENDEN